jgi:hypothetical protein
MTESTTTTRTSPMWPSPRHRKIIGRIIELYEQADVLTARIKRREGALKISAGRVDAQVDQQLAVLVRLHETAVGSAEALDRVLADEQGRAS